MSVSDQERERLHLMLDSLLNARNRLEKIDPKKLERPFFYFHWSLPRKELFNNASLFLRSAVGKKLFEAELSSLFELPLKENENSPDLLSHLANAIRSFLPLFMQEARHEGLSENENITKIIDDFIATYWGDEPRFFSIFPRRQGQHKRPYRLAKLRLKALNWDKYLSAVGVPAKDRHNYLSQSYKTDWDAIRKWAKSVEEQYDFISYPPSDLERALREFQDNPDFVFQSITDDGEAYWLELQSAKSGKES